MYIGCLPWTTGERHEAGGIKPVKDMSITVTLHWIVRFPQHTSPSMYAEMDK